MLNKRYINKLKKDTLSYAEKRRHVIKHADDALHHAKRAIFALHRDNMEEAETKLKDAEKLLMGLQKKFKQDVRMASEGAYRAALEEYAEARLFHQFLISGRVGEIKTLQMSVESYLGGLCDLPGELLRYAIKSATNGDEKMVKKCAAMAQEIVGELIEFNLTKHLRHKFDQAKHAVQKLEVVVYELSLK